MTEKSKRGRKKISEGGKESPRQIYVACAALINGVLTLEEIHCQGSDSKTKDSDIVDEAVQRFVEIHGVAPAEVGTPRFYRKPVGEKRKRDTISLSMEDVVFVADRKAVAVYRGWEVAVKFVEDNDEAAYIIYKKHTEEEKKTKPQSKFVRIDSLENLVEDSENSEDAAA